MDNQIRRLQRRMLSTVRGSKKWRRIVSTLSCVVVFCTTYALILPAITATKPTYCGLEEHTHTSECGVSVLTCTLPEEANHVHTTDCYSTNKVLICDLTESAGHVHTEACNATATLRVCGYEEESEVHTHTAECFETRSFIGCGLNEDEGHTHTDACYTMQETLTCNPHVHGSGCYTQETTCGMVKHTHTEKCYEVPDETETQNVDEWKKKLPDTTGHWANDLLAAVRSQMGYTESAVDKDETGNGRTFYGEAYGVPYANWDAAFVSWALEQIGVPKAPTEEVPAYFPQNGNTEYWTADLQSRGLFHEGKEGWNPRPGDLMFFSVDGGRGFKRVSVVVEASFDEEGKLSTVRSIMGDCEDKVDDIVWNVSALTIQGWARLPVNPEHPELYTEEGTNTVVEENDSTAKEPTVNLSSLREDTTVWAEELYESGDLRVTQAEYLPGDILFLENESGVIFSALVLDTQKDEAGTITAVQLAWRGAEELVERPEELSMVGWVRLPQEPEQGEASKDKDGESGQVSTAWLEVEFDSENLFAARPSGLSLEEGDNPLILGGPESGSGNARIAELKWKDPSVTPTVWHNYADGDAIPANAVLEIVMEFGNLDPSLLKPHGYKMAYYADDILAELQATDVIRVRGEVRGTIEAVTVGEGEEAQTMILMDFNSAKDWIDGMGTSTLQGSFTYQGGLNLDKLKDNEENKILLAGIEIKVPDAKDAVAKFADVSIEKSEATLVKNADGKVLLDSNGNGYLEYTLTVTAGEYGCPDVKLIDRMTGNGMGNYVGVTGTPVLPNGNVNDKPKELPTPTAASGHKVYLTNDTAQSITKTHTTPSEGGTNNLAWVIGDMEPGEVRTLTYRRMVTANYLATTHVNDAITNTASLFSRSFPRGSDTASYIPRTDVDIKKQTMEIHEPEEGSGVWTLDYLVTVTADKRNELPLKDVKIWDRAHSGDNSRPDSAQPTLLDATIKVYDSTGNVITGLPAPTKVNQSQREYYIPIGDMQPGETKTIKYSITLDEKEAEKVSNGDIGILNRAEVRSSTNQTLNGYQTWDRFASHQWARKNSGGQLMESVKEEIDGSQVYAYSGGNLVKTPTSSSPYRIDRGAYKYQVLVNEAGNSLGDESWNVTETVLTDTISNQHLTYTQYVRVEAYDSITIENGQYVGHGTPTVRWINVNGRNSFSFTPSQIGMEDRPQAYLLTYYVAVGNGLKGQQNAGNSFGLVGTVGNGSGGYINLSTSTNVNITVKESGLVSPKKRAWYYDPNDTVFDDCPNGDSNGMGALYWMIELDGGKIPHSTGLDDIVNDGNHITHNDLAIVGLYQVKFAPEMEDEDRHLEQIYKNNTELQAAVIPQEFPEDAVAAEPGVYLMPAGISFYNNHSDFQPDHKAQCSPTKNDFGFWFSAIGNQYPDHPSNAFWGTNRNDPETWRDSYIVPADTKIYLVVRTQPRLPRRDGEVFNVTNKLDYTLNGTKWESAATVTQPVKAPNGSMSKNPGSVYTKKGSTFKKIGITSDSIRTDIYYDWGSGWKDPWGNTSDITYQYSDGTYVSWLVTINADGESLGAYDIVDNLPKGLELCYVRTSNCYNNFNAKGSNEQEWDNYYSGAPGYDKMPADGRMPNGGWNLNNGGNVQNVGINPGKGWGFTISGPKDEWLTEGFTAHRLAAPCTNTGGDVYTNDQRTATLFYSKTNSDGTQEVRVHLPYVQKSKPVQLQIVCKLTEAAQLETMLGDVTFNNQANLFDSQGNLVEADGAEITVNGGGLSKNALMDGAMGTGDNADKLATTRFPYEIVINEDRNDMMPNSDVITLPLVDRMTGNMSIDLSSLKIYQEASVDDAAHLLYYGGLYELDSRESGQPPKTQPWFTTDVDLVNKTVGNVDKTRSSIVVSTRDATEPDGRPMLDASGTQYKEILFANLPDNTKLIISYSVSLTVNGSTVTFQNKAYWEGHEENSNGENPVKTLEYAASAEMSETDHGAVHIRKYDADDSSIGLQDAVFALYRAEYTIASDNMVFDFHGNKLDPVAGHYLAVYQGTDTSLTSNDPEIAVKRNNDGSLYQVEVRKNDGTKEWMSVVDALSRQYRFHHDLALKDGKMQLCSQGALAKAKTDKNGNVSYGFGYDAEGHSLDFGEPLEGYENSSRVHFNKVYAIVEEAPPAGYSKDDTIHFFVVPNSHGSYNGSGFNYFYHSTWPEGVHVCTLTENGELTYMLGVANEKSKLTITKDFGGSMTAFQPGEYKFGIWEEKDIGDPTPDNMVFPNEPISLTYREDDFLYDTEGNVLGLKPGLDVSVSFPKSLDYGTYYMYELNDAGFPIVPENGTAVGTIHGTLYYPSFSGTSVTGDAYGKIIFQKEKHDITVTNNSYSAKVTKRFEGVDGNVMEHGLAGSYTFGISEKKTSGTYTKDDVIKTVTITWEKGVDLTPTKSAYFTDLKPNQEYVIFELDGSGEPVTHQSSFTHKEPDGTGSRVFTVEYDSGVISDVNATGILSGTNDGNVTITNISTIYLPMTGGMGTELFTHCGLMLVIIACVGYGICLLRRRGKEDRA